MCLLLNKEVPSRSNCRTKFYFRNVDMTLWKTNYLSDNAIYMFFILCAKHNNKSFEDGSTFRCETIANIFTTLITSVSLCGISGTVNNVLGYVR